MSRPSTAELKKKFDLKPSSSERLGSSSDEKSLSFIKVLSSSQILSRPSSVLEAPDRLSRPFVVSRPYSGNTPAASKIKVPHKAKKLKESSSKESVEQLVTNSININIHPPDKVELKSETGIEKAEQKDEAGPSKPVSQNLEAESAEVKEAASKEKPKVPNEKISADKNTEQTQKKATEQEPEEEYGSHELAGKISIILPEDLLAAKRKLKKQRRGSFDPITLSRRELLQAVSDAELEFLPIPSLLSVVNENSMSADLVCLNVSSIEQMTDSFFLALKTSKGVFINLKKLICIGCVHLTDQGVVWASELFPLTTVEFQGCSQLTEKSLYYLAKNCPNLNTAAFTGTNIARLPSKLADTELFSFNIAGCPVISASEQFSVGLKPKIKGDVKETVYVKVPSKKLVVLTHADLTVSVGSLLMNQGKGETVKTLWYGKDWKLDDSSALNILEFPADSPLRDVGITPGCMVVIAYPASKIESNDLYKNLASVVASVISTCSDVVVALAAVTDNSQEISTSDVLTKVCGILEMLHEAMFTNLTSLISSRKWKLEKVDFYEQLSLSAGSRLNESLMKMIQSKDTILSFSVNTSEPQSTETINTIRQMTETVEKHFPWIYDPYSSYSIAAMDHVPKVLFINLLEIFNAIPEVAKKPFMTVHPFTQIGKVVELMDKCGKVFYFPHMKHKPAISDIEQFAKILTKLDTSRPPQKIRIKCLSSEPIGFWNKTQLEDCIGEAYGENQTDKKVSGLRKLITNHGLLIALARGTQLLADSKFTDSTTEKLYMKHQSLPTSPPVSLSFFWPDDLPPETVQADKFYSVLPSIPQSFFPILINKCLKVFKMTLLWKSGFLIQLGTVDILVELLSNKGENLEGSPVLFASARIPVISKSYDWNLEFSRQCLWSTFAIVTTVLESACKDAKLYTYITIPCFTCNPKQNRELSLYRNKCYHFIQAVAKASADRLLTCKLEEDNHEEGSTLKVPCLVVKESIGIDVQTVVPYHNYSYMSSVQPVLRKTFRQDPVKPYSLQKCFLCSDEDDTTCLHCGVCKKCTKHLAEAERNIKPGFVLRKLVPGCEAHHKIGNNLNNLTNKIVGCMFATRKPTQLLIQKQMSSVYFNELSLTVLRRSDVTLTLTLNNGKWLQYQAKCGIIINLDGSSESQTSWKCRDGNIIKVRIEDTKKSDVVSGQTEVVLILSDYEMKRVTVDSCEVIVHIVSEGNGLYTLHTPGVKESWQYQNSFQFKEGMKLLVKPDAKDCCKEPPKSFVLAEVSHEPDQKSLQGVVYVSYMLDNQLITSKHGPILKGLLPLTEKTWQQLTIGSKMNSAVLMSYSKDNEEKMLKIWSRLNRAGHTVVSLKDFSEIGMSFVHNKDELVRMARVILVGLSKSFENDTVCEREADLCMKFKKHVVPLKLEENYIPSGFVVTLVKNKPVFDFVKDDFSDNKLAKLLNHLEASIMAAKLERLKVPDGMASTSSQELDPGYVVISFNKSDQKMALRIRNHLKSSGYEVWMDYTRVDSSSFKSLKIKKPATFQEAMDHSSVILICLSQKYSENEENNKEADYVAQLTKFMIPIIVEPGYYPDDWLGQMVSGPLPIDMSKPALLDNGMNQLYKYLGDMGKMKQEDSVYSGPVPENVAPLWLFSERQVSGNYQDFLPDSAIDDIKSYLIPCLSTQTASVINSRMLSFKNAVEEAFFQNGGISYNGSLTVLLPQTMTEEEVKWPAQSLLHKPLNSHPLCYTRGDMSMMMTMSPSQHLTSDGSMFWTAHILDFPGFPYNLNTDATELPLLWAWHFILMMNQQYHLSSYENIFEGVKDINPHTVCKCIGNFLHKMCLFLFIGLGLDFSEEFLTDFQTLEASVKILKRQKHKKHAVVGLMEVEHLFNEKEVYLCKTHQSAWNVSNNLTCVPSENFDKYSPFIRSLQLQGNKLVSLPRELFTKLINLMDLDISMNEIEKLPKEIGNCLFMNSLNLQQNRLQKLPDTLVNCQQMCRLDISGNFLEELPPFVTKLKSLTRLYALNMQFSSLPEDIGELQQLTKLYLGGNCFTSLPNGFSKLQNLTELGLNGVAWLPVKLNTFLSKEHFEEILKSYHLSNWLEKNHKNKAAIFCHFDEDANGTLDAQEMGKLNATIFYSFPRFGYMSAELPDDDTPHGFPEQILSLTKLEYLSLQFQAIVSLPENIHKLKNLKVLNLRHNPNLLSIPAQTGNLPLKRLELESCPLLKTPPKEIRMKGFATTYAYLQRLLSGSIECKRTKLMLVGLGGAGKTSLVKALLSGFNKAHLALTEDITDGIDICPWSVFTDDGKLTYSVWDFAGQSVYYNTHQFFLSDRAVYMLTWNIRLGFEHAGLDFWLSSISVHAPSAPIFVVGSHVDQVARVELPVKEMQDRYPQIVGFHFISSHTGQGIKELKDSLIEVTLKQQYMGEKIPGVWLKFEDSLASLKDRSVIEYKECENKAHACGIFDQSEVFQAVQFLHELGSLQHFTNDFLKSYVVVNPQWIVDVMSCVVSLKDSHIKEGRLNHSDIGKVWKDYPPELHSWLLRLTEEFDLTFPLASQKVNLVPCLLPEKQPEINWPEVDKHSTLYEAKLVYKFHYLPAGLFNRGQVRLHEFSDSSLIWKRGSFLNKNKHICLIHQTQESELVVKAQGPRPENILFLVHEVFENLIAEFFQGVTYDYFLPCPDCMKLRLKDPFMFAASIVNRAKELKAPFLQCLKYFHSISLVVLQSHMPPCSSMDYDLHLIQAVQGLKELTSDTSPDIFISYCQKDKPSPRNVHKFISPQQIVTDLQAAKYKCWYKENSEQWSMDELVRALMDASVVLVLISDAFVQDEDCCNLFKYARLTLNKQILLVVIGTGMKWLHSRLGILVADEVFVNMLQPERYSNKLKELLDMLKIRINKDVKVEEFPPCFISYSWKNSATAIDLGSKPAEGSVGVSDPRKIKAFLEEKGIKCWIDIERIGLNRLFDDIAEGLLNAKVVVACVSDEYAMSSSCTREFRYAVSTLKLPIVLAVVGTKNKWRATEIGVLSLNFPLISFQERFDTPCEKLYELIGEILASDAVKANVSQTSAMKAKIDEDHKNLSFQELFELAQRKFLRQVIVFADRHEIPYPYPRLFLLDLIPTEHFSSTSICSDNQPEQSDSKTDEDTDDEKNNKYVVQILCEHEEGWHCCSDPIPLPQTSGKSPKERFGPYLTRIMGIAKYSKKLSLKCMSTKAGQEYLKWLNESSQVAAASDYHHSYQDLRNEVINADTKRIMGNLKRCHLTNGKIIWLCKEHYSNMQVTVLGDDVIQAKISTAENLTVDYMTMSMREPEPIILGKRQSNTKVESDDNLQAAVSGSFIKRSQMVMPNDDYEIKLTPSLQCSLRTANSPEVKQLSKTKSSTKVTNHSAACSLQ